MESNLRVTQRTTATFRAPRIRVVSNDDLASVGRDLPRASRRYREANFPHKTSENDGDVPPVYIFNRENFGHPRIHDAWIS